MEFLTTSNSKKPRGIIVIDTSALVNLCTPVPEQFVMKTGLSLKHPPQFADALFYLAQQGFEIHIPEIVANEAGQYLRDGNSFSHLFQSSNDYHHPCDFDESLPLLPFEGSNSKMNIGNVVKHFFQSI